MTKRCPRCKVTKDLSNFNIRKSGNRTGHALAHCKACSATQAAIRKTKTDVYRRIEWPSKLKRLYGITVDQYYGMLADQGGSCAICKAVVPCSRRHKNRETEMFFVDHCHATGIVRGLLCNACNRALGYFRDNPEIVDRAADYLRRSQSEQ